LWIVESIVHLNCYDISFKVNSFHEEHLYVIA
jgi:hypothetical protein